MIRIARIGMLIIFALWGSGCTTIAPSTPEKAAMVSAPDWQTRAKALANLQSWQLSGKIAVQTQQDAGSASIDWVQRNRQYTVSLMGPLGAHSLKLTGKPGKVMLEMSDGTRATASNPEELLAREWGFHLPVSYLNYWIRGLPVPSLPSQKSFDATHRLSTLAQQGWHIQFQRYTSIGHVDLPDKLLITSADLRTRIIIYKWNIAH